MFVRSDTVKAPVLPVTLSRRTNTLVSSMSQVHDSTAQFQRPNAHDIRRGSGSVVRASWLHPRLHNSTIRPSKSCKVLTHGTTRQSLHPSPGTVLVVVADFGLGSVLPKPPELRPSFGDLPERCEPHMVRVVPARRFRHAHDHGSDDSVVGYENFRSSRPKVFWRSHPQWPRGFPGQPALPRFCELRHRREKGLALQVELE